MREAEILDLLRSHDDNGMEELMRHYGPLMRYIIKPILRDRHDMEDCLSETAMRIWENFDTYDEDKGSFAAWVTAITRNTALNMIRRKNRHPADEMEDEIESTEPTPEEIVLKEERQRELRRALDLLSQKERNLFYRKYYYLQSTEKIAAEMGMTVRSVEGKLYRTENVYEVHMLLTGRKELRYLTIGCEKIEIQTGVYPDWADAEDALTSTLTGMIGNLQPVPDAPVIEVYPEPIYFDYTEKDNTRWLSLMKNALKNAKTFEIHCWNEETDEIALALQYGNFKESSWRYGKVITGEVTPAFMEMLLSQPKPADLEAANKMTPFFNIFLDNGFQSCHWGTEIYPGE